MASASLGADGDAEGLAVGPASPVVRVRRIEVEVVERVGVRPFDAEVAVGAEPHAAVASISDVVGAAGVEHAAGRACPSTPGRS